MGEFPTAHEMFWELKKPENKTLLEDILARERKIVASKSKALPWQTTKEMYAEIASDVNALLDSNVPLAELQVDESRFSWKNALYTLPGFAAVYGINNFTLNYSGWEALMPAVAVLCAAGPLVMGVNTTDGKYSHLKRAIHIQGRGHHLARVLAHEHTHHVQSCNDTGNKLVSPPEATLKEIMQKVVKVSSFVEGIAMNVEYLECGTLSERYADQGFSARATKVQRSMLKDALHLLRGSEAPEDDTTFSFIQYRNPLGIFTPRQYTLGNAYYRIQREKHGPGVLAEEIKNIAA